MTLYDTDVSSYKKDMGSRAVLNSDQASLIRYKSEREKRQNLSRLSDRMDSLEDKLDSLNSIIGELIASLKR